MKIASMKNEMPSSPKPTPNTSPNVAMKFGHSRPNSKDRIVPVTTPTAKIVIATFDHRFASALYVTSPVRMYRPSTNRNIAGNAIPKQTIGMCTASDSACIWRASTVSGCWDPPPSVSTTCWAKTVEVIPPGRYPVRVGDGHGGQARGASAARLVPDCGRGKLAVRGDHRRGGGGYLRPRRAARRRAPDHRRAAGEHAAAAGRALDEGPRGARRARRRRRDAGGVPGHRGDRDRGRAVDL